MNKKKPSKGNAKKTKNNNVKKKASPTKKVAVKKKEKITKNTVTKKKVAKKTVAKKTVVKKTAKAAKSIVKKADKKTSLPASAKAPVSRKEVEKVIKSIIAEVMEIDEKMITSKTRFFEDLGMDSMMALEILAMIEKVYKIEITEEDFPEIVNYESAINLTMKLFKRKKK